MVEVQAPQVPRQANTSGGIYDRLCRYGQMIRRPWEAIKYVASPCQDPSGALRRIGEAADRGIQKAKIGGVTVTNRAPDLNAELNHALVQRGVGPEARRRVGIVGEVANLGPLAQDREATLAPRLQERVNATDWQERQKDLQAKLKDKLSVFTALCQMRDRAGIVEANNLKIMGLVKQATEGANPVSVWELFTANYQLSFFQTLFAGWFYWIYYMTSLISNTIDAYLGSFTDRVTAKLTTESDATRQKVLRAAIEGTNDFLVQDFNATEKYANGEEPGLLRQIRDRAIERHYGFSLEALCQSFAEYIVENDRPPTVRFFKDLQEIPIVGIVFSLFEYLVNKFIQWTMKNKLLPKVLEQGVTKGLEATQPDKLPFSIALTKFFTSQLERLRIVVENDDGSESASTENFPGTEMLPQTIRLLMQALELEGDLNPQELRDKILEVQKKKSFTDRVLDPLDVDGKIQEGIEKGVTGAVQKLFWELNRSARSHELFAKLMELTLAPFSDEGKTEEMLRAEYEEEQKKFERTASSVFKTLVRNEVSKIFKRGTSEHQAQAAKDSLSTQKVVVHELVERMGDVCNRIEEKIAASRQAPAEANNVQGDIAELLQIMQVLSSRKELQNQKEHLDGIHQNEIWAQLVPLYERAEKMLDQLLLLQDDQHQYTSHHSVHTYLTEIRALLTTIQDEFHAQPRLLQNPLLQSLKRASDEITKTLGADAPIPIHLNEMVEEATLRSTSIAKEQSVIDAILALYPPGGEDGLIDQLLKFQQGIRIPGFRPRECMAKIAENLACFPLDEQSQHEKRELERIIGDGSNIQGKLRELSGVLQSMYARHRQIMTQEKAVLDHFLDGAKRWINEKIVVYQHIKEQNHKKMRDEAGKIATNMKTLKKRASKISTSLTVPVSDGIFKTMAAACPVVGTVALGPVWGPISGAVGGVGLRYMQGSGSGESEGFLRSSLKKVGKVGAAALLSWNLPNLVPDWAFDKLQTVAGYMPSLVTGNVPTLDAVQHGSKVATGLLAGAELVDWGQSGIEERVFNKVWGIFTRGYDLSLDPRVYKAATTRTLKAIVEAG